MKRFAQKWQECVRRAGGPAPPETAAPAGFAARVVALHFQADRVSWQNLWWRFSLPALSASAALLFLTALLYWRSPISSADELRPPLENAIIEQIRLL